MTEIVYEKGVLYHISIIDFKPDPDQPRKYYNSQSLEELAASIRTQGVISPLLFRVSEDSPYLLIVAGERRYKAAQMVGLLVLPALYVEGNYQEISLVENLLRQDLTPIEEAEALKRLMDERNYTQDQLSGVIGKSPSILSETLSLNRLPLIIRDECRIDPTVPKRNLIEIARCKQERAMVTLYNKYKTGKLSKEKLSKEARRDRRTTTEATLEVLAKTKTRIAALNMEELSETDHNSIAVALTEIRQLIDEKVNREPSKNLT